MAILYMVATPVGNLQDMTYRAVEVLKEVDIIACEDTRLSAKLLNHYGIQKHLISCRARNEKQSAPGIVKLLDEGKNIAYVSDAGTPVMSDPGRLLVRQCRDAGHEIFPIPGASAFTTLVSVCGFHGKSFHFEGFLSPKSGKRKKRLQELLNREESFMIYESPYRVVKVLEEIREMEPEREILLGREMTKKFEEYIEGTADKLINHLETGNHSKGEFALLVSAEKKG
ncbi:16S rRNA (cytidine(1402)-2'-O)-methyltransferase [Oceanispirochaeta crateris]|uniref:Ribosomal RNA small subunit methyltransferase I n=1 Tax=Oceanispirochaeta crateris TaxID=2518645 RepID=A0A5C1QRN7_9SPIO|nr:16S rRNA (cytidine(1402)-2'-O)-methyltransferase [Oceanispirochaeta crateris]QEN09226.1 16S rRNA (cytidine(1402)-2'-O)-methyltransferase [Oceanispirochaeta crateris]